MKNIYLVALIAVLLSSCGSSYTYEKPPVDKIIVEKSNLTNYSIILADMDYDEGNDLYKHKYRLIYQPLSNPDTLLTESTDWYKVSPEYFQEHVNDLGMALATIKNGVADKKVSPAGYANYVGNEKYGRWERREGRSFWHFYGQYMFMRSMFHMMSPVHYSYYQDYRTHRAYGRTYYGSAGNGRTMYGTNSSYGKSTSWGTKSSTFKQRVRSKVKKSSERMKMRRYMSRNSSRRGTSTRRSYGGGFGK